MLSKNSPVMVSFQEFDRYAHPTRHVSDENLQDYPRNNAPSLDGQAEGYHAIPSENRIYPNQSTPGFANRIPPLHPQNWTAAYFDGMSLDNINANYSCVGNLESL